LDKIKHLLARYSAFLWALLKPLGTWGVLVIAMLDGGFIGLPMDVVVAGYVYNDRAHFFWYAFSASVGSAVGSIVIYVIGYIGGENFLRKRISAQRFEKIHSAFDKHPFWALMFPAMLPPPTPFKLFVLAAAVSEMSLGRFLLAVFSGRMVRFLILAVLTLEFGPDVVHMAVDIFSKHLTVMLVVVAAAAIGWLLHRRAKRLGQTV
jgi:membrane protein YqaA with SNARE-associated domain